MTAFPKIETGPGVTRQVLADHPDLMVVDFSFGKAGATGALQSHPRVQSTFVRSGRLRFSLNSTETEVGPGESFVVPSHVTHGCVCLEPGTLIDCFTPRRDDFL